MKKLILATLVVGWVLSVLLVGRAEDSRQDELSIADPKAKTITELFRLSEFGETQVLIRADGTIWVKDDVQRKRLIAFVERLQASYSDLKTKTN